MAAKKIPIPFEKLPTAVRRALTGAGYNSTLQQLAMLTRELTARGLAFERSQP